jgi:hypothetical protein
MFRKISSLPNVIPVVSYHISFILAGFVNYEEEPNPQVVNVPKYPSNPIGEQPLVRDPLAL